MKRIITIILLLIFSVTANASDYKNDIEILANDYNISAENLNKISISEIYNYISEYIVEYGKEPVKVTLGLLFTILICSVVNAYYSDKQNNIAKVTDAVCTRVIYLGLITPIRDLILLVSDNLFDVKTFMQSFIPIFAGISIASGDGITAGVYTGLFLSGLIFISNLYIKYILPSIQFYFAVIIANAVSEYINLKNFSDFYIKLIKNCMKWSVSIICSVLTLQTIISQGADTMVVKAGKAIAGGAIPVIGSALQDAIGSVYASMEAIKGFAGAVGIAVIISIFAPSLLALSVYWLCANVLYIFSGLFNEKQISLCVKGYIDIIEVTFSVTILFSIMLMFSITIMITLTNGV